MIFPTPGGPAFGPRDDNAIKPKISRRTVRAVLELGRPYIGTLSFFLFLVVLQTATSVVNPLVFRRLIDRGVVVGDEKEVIRMALLAAALSLADTGLMFVHRYLAVKVGQDIVLDLRRKVFVHVQRMSLGFFNRTRTGALVTRLNTDISGAGSAFSNVLTAAVGNVLTVVFILSAMFALSWRLTLAALVVMPIYMVAAGIIGRQLRELTRAAFDRTSEMNHLMVERFNVSGATVMKIFGRADEESTIFGRLAQRVRDINVHSANVGRPLYAGGSLLVGLGVIIVYGWGGVLTVRGSMEIGTLVALVGYLYRVYGPLLSLSNLQVDVLTTLVSFERVFEVLALKPTITDRPGAVPVPAGPVRIEFDHVGFRYPTATEVSLASLESVAVLSQHPERDVLHDVSFVAEPGQLVALVGPSGAGKSTLAQLIARLYDVQAGSVRMNGVDLRDATQDSIQGVVGMVMQDAHLFHDTLRANLLYAKPGASDAELLAALRDAQILPTVEALPQGIDTMVGERGHRLSGGERARVSIARLLLKAPAVVVLDEATAHLDSESERAIQQAFQTALAGRTSLVIAHRLSTVQHADQILVLDQGRIVERGRHEELLRAGKLYAQLCRTQFSVPAGPHEIEARAPSVRAG
ncbi:MAG TPA: ABC transporter ATP-binding protein [Opitutaceae bacterium]|jgi:ATP-binding cassette subfamily B protein